MILPLLVPQKQFTDRFGNACAYSEMNPSMYYDSEKEEYIVLVRLVNYRKFKDRGFTLYESHSKSEYMISRTKTLNTLQFVPLVCFYGSLKTHWTYWKGVEDIRFIDSETVLCCVPELHSSGSPSIFQASLKENTLYNFILCSPAPNEKNWMPFGEKVIYSIHPFVIKSIHEDDRQLIGNVSELDGYHGSTNGIQIEDGWLFLIHKNVNQKVVHRWILYNEKTTSLSYSNEFSFFSNSYIEFPCSLVHLNSKLIVSLGVNDDKAFLMDMDSSSVLKGLIHTCPFDTLNGLKMM